MPEWPEVRNVIQGVFPSIMHRPLIKAKAHESLSGHAWWEPGRLYGMVVWAIEQHGKLIVIHLVDADWYESKYVRRDKNEAIQQPPKRKRKMIACHLMMTGLLTPFQVDKRLEKHNRATLTFGADARIRSESGFMAVTPEHIAQATDEHRAKVRVRFIDPRKFGKLWLVRRPKHMDELRKNMGPDAMALVSSFRGDLKTVARWRTLPQTRTLKAMVMDQRGVAGYGNIYAAEALFAAGLSPRRKLADTADAWLALMAREGARIMRLSATRGGSTIDSYRHPDGSSGEAQHAHMVYGRTGQDCYVCDTPLNSEQIDGRTTVWCPSCQR